MSGDRWQTIERVYHAAVDMPPGEREAFLDRACGGDDGLREEVESLLRHAPAAESFIEEPAAAWFGDGPDGSRDGDDLIGRQLGDFRVVSRLGSGGMGEVYRAHDGRLDRDVAIKVLPSAFARDPERLDRFRREARLLASLNHPNIGSIYGLQGDDVAPALILELIEGPTLAEIIDRAASSGRGLRIDEVLSIARQIVDALEAAHDRGVVHRDLKPANVKLTREGTVKVLDFGVANALSAGVDEALPSRSSTLTDTRHGVIIGTPNYMSPEQARGEPVDRRSDIWAFGCVLFEMLTGRPTFAGNTTSDTLAAVLEREPDWEALPTSTPSGVRRLLRRCLDRSLKRRLRDIGDARLDLDEDAGDERPAGTTRAGARRPGTWALGLAALAVAVAIAVIPLVWPPTEAPPPLVQFTLDPPPGQTLVGAPVPSLDGRRIVVVARAASGESALWMRTLESPSFQRLRGTENALRPFWSADGRFVGFTADGLLKRVSLEGGLVQRITQAEPVVMGASWSRDDVILFAPTNRSPLHRISAGGGGRAPLTTLNDERRENSHRWPHFLPDGRHFLFTARSDLPQYTGIYVATLESPATPKWLMPTQSAAMYASGHLLYVREGTLVAQPFDVRRLELSGEPVALTDVVRVDTTSSEAYFAVSGDGTVLTYAGVGARRLSWFDRSGRRTDVPAARGDFSQLQLSPDGSRAAVVIPDQESGNRDVWVIRLEDGSLSRLTSDPTHDWFPVWSPDGAELVFASDRDTRQTFYRRSADGAGPEQLLFRAASAGAFFPTDWSRDGRMLAFHSYPRGDVSLLPLAGGPPVAVVESPFTDWVAALSPDGRWLAYISDESGVEQVYVRALRGAGRYRVSANGGIQARWRSDGRELFFLAPGQALMSVPMTAGGATLVAGSPVRLFDGCSSGRPNTFSYLYDLVADGSRSLWLCGDDEGASALVTLHWTSMLTRGAP